jgi:hypothetical protein
VGKSSTLNSLLGEKAAAVSAFKLQPDTESSSSYVKQVRGCVGVKCACTSGGEGVAGEMVVGQLGVLGEGRIYGMSYCQ